MIGGERLRAAIVTLGMGLAVLSPGIPDAGGTHQDGYPFSWYPMFSSSRPPVERVTWIRAVLADGSDRPVPVWYWTPGGLSEGRNQLEGAVKARGDAPADFCARLARRFARRDHGWESTVVELRIVTSRWVLTRYFTEPAPTPEREQVVLTCPVAR